MTPSQSKGAETAGSAVPIEAFFHDAHQLDDQEFEARYGNAFLLLSAASLSIPTGPSVTEVKLFGDDDAGARTANVSLLVFPIRRTDHSITHLVTIGRTKNNDVVIRDAGISRFHAFVKYDENGGLLIQDAGSTNGTTVNGDGVAARGAGPPSPVKRGDDIRLGQVDFTFVDGAGLRAFAIKAS